MPSYIGKDAVTTKTTHRCFKRFRNGDFSPKNEQRLERPTEIDLSELNSR